MKTVFYRLVWIASALICSTVPVAASQRASNPGTPSPGSKDLAPLEKAAKDTFLGSSIEFQANRGQFRPEIDFLARTANYSIAIGSDSFTLHPATHHHNQDSQDTSPISVKFLGANPTVHPQSITASGAYANYLVGDDPSRWLHKIPLAERIRTTNLYPGVDLDFYGNQKQLEYDLTVAPGADADQIRIVAQGTESISPNAKGELTLSPQDQKNNDGTFIMHAPVAYQISAGGTRHLVQAAYRLVEDAASGTQIRFALGDYDHTRPLVIDPTVTVVYASYLGGSGDDTSLGIVLDAAGSIYVTGFTYSTDYPVVNPLQTSGSIFISKLNAAGTALIYSTYLGGSSGNDSPGGTNNGSVSGRPLAVDSSGTAYLVGTTQSGDFPVTSSAFQTASSAQPNAGFLLRLSADGSKLLYSSVFGAGLTPVAVAADNSGHAYMTGSGGTPNIPETANAYYTPSPDNYKDYGGFLAFLSEFDTTMSGRASLPYSTVFGHISTAGVDIALDSAGNIDILGATGSVFGLGNGTIDIAGNAYESGPFSVITPWIAQFSLLQGIPSTLVASTYLGGAGAPGEQSAVNTPISMGVDGANHVYITGTTTSTTFPTYRAIQGNLQTTTNAFLTEMTSNLQYLVFSTYIGDASSFAPSSMAVASNGDVILTGDGGPGLISVNAIPSVTPPTVVGGNVSQDGVLIGVASGGQSENYATYLGITGGIPSPSFLALDANENVYLYATGGSITPTPGALQQTSNSQDGSPYLLKLVFQNTVNTVINRIAPVSGANTGVTTVNVYGTGFQTGESLTLSCGGQSYSGAIFSLTNSVLSAYVDLRGAAAGTCDVVVSNPAIGSATATSAFSVDSVASPLVFAQVVGPGILREGTGQVYTIAYGNTGNTDVYSVPLNLAFPDYLSYTLITPLQQPPQVSGGATVDYSHWPADYNDGNGNTVVAMILPIIRAGSNNIIEVRLSAPNEPQYNDVIFNISATAQQPWEALNPTPSSSSAKLVLPFNSADVKPILLAALATGNSPLPLGIGSQLFAGDLFLTPEASLLLQRARQRRPKPSASASPADLTPGQIQFAKDLVTTPLGKRCIADAIDFTFRALSVIPGVGCAGDLGLGLVSTQLQSLVTGDTSVPILGPGAGQAALIAGGLSALGCFPPTAPFKSIIDAGAAGVSGLKLLSDCSMLINGSPGKPLPVGVRGPGDPNFKAGPPGAGPQQYIPPSQMLTYSVNFANEPTAGAAAQNVTATDTVDPTKVDLTTFAFGPIVIGNHSYTPAPNATSINAQIDLRPDVSIIAQVNASINPSTGLVTWQFGSLDPATGLPISSNSLSGFLPPDTATPNGEVAVSFSANSIKGLTTGATISNTAGIVFDGQPAMATNTWVNTIDSDAPHSTVTRLPSVTPATAVNVSWSGTDAGSGIAAYTIYVSDNGGPFTPWLTATSATSAVFTGTAGHLYGFFSLAIDAAGNGEPAKTIADTSTTLSLATSATTLTPVPGPIAANSPVTFTAVVTGNPSLAGSPTGTVTFSTPSTSLGTATLSASGTATFTTSGFSSGTPSITASYSGDSNYTSSIASPIMLNIVNLPSPTITFAVPNHIFGDSPVPLAATSNSTGAITYTVLSGPAAISGSTLNLTGAGSITLQVNQAATATYATGMLLVNFTVAPATPAITWRPTVSSVYSGFAIGAGVLNASSSTPGGFLYTATPAGGVPANVSTTTVLPDGPYTLTATFTPTDTADYTGVSATVPFTVAVQHIWVVNSTGTLSSLDDAGSPLNPASTSAAGIGIAIDNAGSIWSLNRSGNTLSQFNNLGVYTNGFFGGGLTAATALAIDGNGAIWVTNGNGTVSVFTNAGVPLSPSTGYTGGNLSAPAGVAIDLAGNVWISNSGNNSVTEILGSAAPVAPIAVGVTNSTLGSKP